MAASKAGKLIPTARGIDIVNRLLSGSSTGSSIDSQLEVVMRNFQEFPFKGAETGARDQIHWGLLPRNVFAFGVLFRY